MSSSRLVVDFSMDEFHMTLSVASSEKQNQYQLFLIDKGYYLLSHFPLHFLTSRMGKKKVKKTDSNPTEKQISYRVKV